VIPPSAYQTCIDLLLVFDQSLNISVLFDPDTYLPFAIRTYEDHPFFGPSPNDLRVYDYIRVDGLMIPRHFKVMYNNKRLITRDVNNQANQAELALYSRWLALIG
jgi:hypothetical protein